MTPITLDTPTLIELRRARELLMAASKWVRRIEERADDLPSSFLDNTDVAPLRRSIEAFLDAHE